jgi:hypothetical protein
MIYDFQPKAIVVPNKNRKFEFFFIPYHISTYGINGVFISVFSAPNAHVALIIEALLFSSGEKWPK